MVFPVFAFGIAQGRAYTKNRKRFPLRLLVFAVLAKPPFQLALLFGQVRLKLFSPSIYNVLFTPLPGALYCLLWNFFWEKKLAWAAVFPFAALVLLAEACHSDYGGLGVLFAPIPYLFPGKRGNWGYGQYGADSIPGLASSAPVPFFHSRVDPCPRDSGRFGSLQW